MNPQPPCPPAAAPGADPYQDLLATLSATIAPMQALHRQAVETMAPTVQDILRSGNRDAPWIEHTLDQLLSHACIPEGLALFKALCRHYWPLDPQATASYVNAYREMWDGGDHHGTEGVAP